MDPNISAVECREIRRGDLTSFDQVIAQGMGNLERSTGIDQLALELFQSLHRPAIWMLLVILRALGRAPIKVFVGVENDRVLGTASLIMMPKSGYVAGVATDSQARNRGIATKLLERIHLEVQGKGKEWAALDVESDNETAFRLYRKLRYEAVAEFGWYVGPLPTTSVGSGRAATPLEGSQMAEVKAWLTRNLPPAITGPLPPSKNSLSHLEILIRGFNTPARTWRLGPTGHTQAVVRAFYVEKIKTGFMVPLAFDSVPTDEPITSLLMPAIDWIRSEGGTRAVATFREPSGVLDQAMEILRLPKVVSTTLMVRPSLEKPS